MAGPRSDPPIPMFTTARMRSPVDCQGLVLGHAQRHVQDGAVFGGVDVLAGEHRVAPGLHARCPRHVEQQPQRLVGDPLLGIVQAEIGSRGVETLPSAGVVGEQTPQVEPPALGLEVLSQRPPLPSGCEIHVGQSTGVPVGPASARTGGARSALAD